MTKDITERLRPCLKLPVEGAVTVSVEALADALDEIDRLRGVAKGVTLDVAERLEHWAGSLDHELHKEDVACLYDAADALRECHAAKLRYLDRAEAARAVCLALVRMGADPGDPAYELPRIAADARRVASMMMKRVCIVCTPPLATRKCLSCRSPVGETA